MNWIFLMLLSAACNAGCYSAIYLYYLLHIPLQIPQLTANNHTLFCCAIMRFIVRAVLVAKFTNIYTQ
jgi:hypothetical protein